MRGVGFPELYIGFPLVISFLHNINSAYMLIPISQFLLPLELHSHLKGILPPFGIASLSPLALDSQ